MPTLDNDAAEQGNAQRRAQWYAQATGTRDGKGRQRPEPTTVPLPSQRPTGPSWSPTGPSVVWNGQALGDPAVAGRTLDLAVGPRSTRATAATSDGGVWRFDEDTSVGPPRRRWTPLHDGARSPDATTSGANALATGAIAVAWGANAAADKLFIGMGETHPRRPSSAASMPSASLKYPGIGIRVSTGAAGSAGVVQEATHLDGHGVTRLIVERGNPEVVWAATTDGLFRRPATGNRTNWDRITDGSFPGNNWFITDLAITGSGATQVVWAAFWHRGVWRLSGGNWARVPGLDAVSATRPGNMALAASPQAANANAVYLIDELGVIYRFDGTRFRKLTNTPPLLVNQTNGYGYYVLTAAVHPTNPDFLIFGADAAKNPGTATEGTEYEAMLFGKALTAAAPTWNYGFLAANNARDDHHKDAGYLGQGVHADLHRITFGLAADGTTPDPNEVWIACDGGVFRSRTGPARSNFAAQNLGLGTIQFNHLAAHPTAEAIVYAGSQDNGVIRRSGDQVWYETRKGDGGGVAIDPDNPARVAIQYTQHNLLASTSGGARDLWQRRAVPVTGFGTGAGPSEQRSFYAPLRTTPTGSAPMLLLYPTHRLWASRDWGVTWVTLPGDATPTNAQPNVDTITGGAHSLITDVRAGSATIIHACTSQRVYRYTRTAAPANAASLGTWSGPTALPTTGLPGARQITSLAIQSASGPEHLFVGLGGSGSGVDHVWWYDDTGAGTWRGTGLGGGASTAGTFDVPVTSLALDPTDPTVIFAGTALGIWRGVRSGVAPAFTWAWSNVSNDLPETGVLDLSVAVYGTGANQVRILRAATHGRGLWELVLGRAATPDPEVHVRMNTVDGGRRHVTMRATVDPDRIGGATTSWLDSPDIGVRRGTTPLRASQFVDLPTGGIPAPPAFGSVLQATIPRMKDLRTWNGVANRAPIRFIQRVMARRGVAVGIDGDFGGGTTTAVQELQRRLRIWPSGRIDAETWQAFTTSPDLGTGVIDPRQFAQDLRTDVDQVTNAAIVDLTGGNRLFAQVHQRGISAQAAAGVVVAAMVAPLTGTPPVAPTLPNGWAGRIRSQDLSNWVGASGWRLLGYRSPRDDLTDGLPVIVEWTLNPSALGFAANADFVVLVAVHTTDQALTTTQRNPKTVVDTAPAVAARRMRADAVVAIAPP